MGTLFEREPELKTTALAPWFGSNRILAPLVAAELKGCKWVGIPFAGGMAELAHIKASTIVVSDLHRHVINLAKVVAHPQRVAELRRRLADFPFHPDALDYAQTYCEGIDVAECKTDDELIKWAEQYFIACWMGRSHKSGIDDEFNGGLSIRWNANGGDSNTRYRSAVASLEAWQAIMRRCNFSVLDCFDFLSRCEDSAGHGIYCDPPFPGPGDRYKHRFTEADHRRLAGELANFKSCRVVCRFYDHPLIRELYPAPHWKWSAIKGRKQSNEAAPEVLIVNGAAF